jgi:WS/DGAT C-terminal domain
MTDPQNTPAGFARLIQLWTIQLRSLTEGLAGMAGLSQSVLSQSVLSYAGQLNIAAVGDPEAVSDLAVFAAGLAGTLEQLGVDVT